MPDETIEQLHGDPEVDRQAGIKRVITEGFIRLYSNSIQMGSSSWDISFTFGEIIGKEDNKLVILDLAKVSMSPQHAKAFLKVFAKQFAIWEKQHGEVRIPAEFDVTPDPE